MNCLNSFSPFCSLKSWTIHRQFSAPTAKTARFAILNAFASDVAAWNIFKPHAPNPIILCDNFVFIVAFERVKEFNSEPVQNTSVLTEGEYYLSPCQQVVALDIWREWHNSDSIWRTVPIFPFYLEIKIFYRTRNHSTIEYQRWVW